MFEREPQDLVPRKPGDLWTAAAAVTLAARILVSGSIYPWITPLTNAVLAILALAALWQGLLSKRSLGRLALIGLGLYMAGAVLSVPFSISPFGSLRWLVFESGSVLVVLVAAAGRRRIGWVLTAMVAAGVVSAAWAVRQKLGGFAVTLEQGELTEYARNTLLEGRAFGMTFSPDMLAACLGGLLPAGLSALVAARGKLGRPGPERTAALLALVSVFFLAAGIWLARSLGGWMAAGTGMAAWLFLIGRPLGVSAKKIKIFAASLVSAMAAGAVLIMLARGGHVLDTDDPNNPAFQRMENWRAGLKAAWEFPLTGAGGGKFGLAALKHRSVEGNEAKHAHNLFIETLAETGPLGAAGIMVISASFIMGAIRSVRKEEQREAIILSGIAAGGMVALAHSMIDYSFQTAEASTIFWVGLGALSARPGETDDEYKRRGPGLILAAVLLAALALVQAYCFQAARLKSKAGNLAREGKWAEAGQAARAAAKWDGRDEETWDLVARSVAVSARSPAEVEQAVRALEKAVSLNPRYPYYYRDLAFLKSRDDPEQAEALFRKAVELYPNGADLNLQLGRWLARRGQVQEAEKVLLHAGRCTRANSEELFELALLYGREGKTEKADDYLARAAKARPYQSSHAVAFARRLVEKDKKEEAGEFLMDWLQKTPGDEAVERLLYDLQGKGRTD